jgi:hypothetical protein
MKKSGFLPIGSVVKLKDTQDQLFMIFGWLQKSLQKGEIFDYIAVMYPEGLANRIMCFYFNEADIKEVLFEGFRNEKEQEYRDYVCRRVQEMDPVNDFTNT